MLMSLIHMLMSYPVAFRRNLTALTKGAPDIRDKSSEKSSKRKKIDIIYD